MIKYFLSLFLLVGLLFSCNQPLNKEKEQITVVEEIIEPPITEEAIIDEPPTEPESLKTIIDFDNYEVIIYNYDTYNTGSFDFGDTATLEEEMGTSFENLLLEIKPKNLSDSFEIMLLRETHLLVYLSEGKVSKLPNWTQTIGFESLADSANFFFKVGKIERMEINSELEPQFEEIARAIRSLDLSDKMQENLNVADSINDLQLESFIGRNILKIIRSNSGVKEERIVVLNASWGC